MESSRRDALLGLAAVTAPLLVIGCTKSPDDAKVTAKEPPKRLQPPATSHSSGATAQVPVHVIAGDTTTPNVAVTAERTAPTPYDRTVLQSLLEGRVPLTSILPNPEVHRTLRFEPSALPHSFRWNHADLLLDEAHSLLSRALDARSEWRDRYLKFHTFLSELEQFEVLDAIHKEETRAGFYETDSILAHAEEDAAQAMIDKLDEARGNLESIATRQAQNSWQQILAQTILGWLSHVSAYASGAADQHATFNQVNKTVLEHCKDEAFNIANHNVQNDLERIRAEAATRTSDLNGLSKRMTGLAARATWESKSAIFRQLRTDALRRLFAHKRALLSEAGGGLDFPTQLKSALRRCQRDYSDGLEHAVGADLGLHRIFGYEPRLPSAVARAIASDKALNHAPAALDEAIEWTRNASSWLTHFVQRDGLAPVSLSLRRLVLASAWRDFLRSGELSFVIPEDFFPKQSHVRFRGASLHTMDARGVFGASLKVPSTSFYRMRDGSAHDSNQHDIPALRIGAVRRYDAARPPEVAGMSAAFNISPIGSWRLSLTDLSSSDERVREIGDLIFELTVAAST